MMDNKAVPLSILGEGRSGVVKQITGGRDMVHRLAEMGVSPGVEIRLIRGRGPCIVVVMAHRLMIGKGMVDRILVSPEQCNE